MVPKGSVVVEMTGTVSMRNTETEPSKKLLAYPVVPSGANAIARSGSRRRPG
jgi:hypothetical protein